MKSQHINVTINVINILNHYFQTCDSAQDIRYHPRSCHTHNNLHSTDNRKLILRRRMRTSFLLTDAKRHDSYNNKLFNLQLSSKKLFLF